MHFYDALEKVTTPKEPLPDVEQKQPINTVTVQDIEEVKKAYEEKLQTELAKQKEELLEFFKTQSVQVTDETDTIDETIRPEEKQVVDSVGNTIENK